MSPAYVLMGTKRPGPRHGCQCSPDSHTLQEKPYSHFMGKEIEGLDLSPGIRCQAWKPGALLGFSHLYLKPPRRPAIVQ